MRTTVPRTEGQRLLLALPGSLQEQSTALGLRHIVSVYEWRAGKKTPQPEARAKMQTAFGIPIDAWDRRPTAATPPASMPQAPMPAAPLAPVPPPAELGEATRAAEPPPAAPAELASARPSTLEHCLLILDEIRLQRANKELTSSEKMKIAASETQTLALRARLESAAELSEDRYVREHPAWIRLRTALIQTLIPHPAAAQAVAAMLNKLGM